MKLNDYDEVSELMKKLLSLQQLQNVCAKSNKIRFPNDETWYVLSNFSTKVLCINIDEDIKSVVSKLKELGVE